MKKGGGDGTKEEIKKMNIAQLKETLNSKTAKSVPAGMKLVLFGRYVSTWE
jgi:hypothetical protein